MSIYGIHNGVTVGFKKVYDIKNGVTRKLSKGYIIENGVTKKIYTGNPFGDYTGTYTAQEITKDGKQYTLYTMTTSGVLTLNDDAEYWMCAPGAGGRSAQLEEVSSKEKRYRSGNGGGGGRVRSGVLKAGTHVVTVGAGGRKDSNGANTEIIGSETITAIGGEYTGNGASGCGQGYVLYIVNYALDAAGPSGDISGQGVSTIPFGLSMLYAHSAAGGAGGMIYDQNDGNERWSKGGNGGSDGSDGSPINISTYGAGEGGEKGGGKGGYPRNDQASVNGASATFYGSAGGGGALYRVISSDAHTGYGMLYGVAGAGYQGVVYLLIPA